MRTAQTRPLRIIPHIHRATHQIGLYIAAMKDIGVTQAEAHILDHLTVTGDCTIGELHRAFAHRRSTLTSVLDRMSEKNLVARETSTEDRRTFVIRLTKDGKALATRVHKRLQDIEAKVIGSVSAREMNGLAHVLTSLEQALLSGLDETR